MQDVIKAILRILEEGTPELQIAAAQVLGELHPSDAAVVKSLGERLGHAEPYISRHLLTALSKIGTKPAVQELVARVGDPGHDGDLVMHLLRTGGDDVVPLLCEAFDGADLETRLRILEILGGQEHPEVATVMEKALYEPSLSDHAATALVDGLVTAMPAAKLRYFKDRLKKALTKDEELSGEVKAHVLRVYAAADPKGARALLVKFAAPDELPSMRHAALVGLRGVALTPTMAAGFLDYLTENDFDRIVQPTMDLLVEHAKWTDAGVAKLRKLLSSRRDHLRLFAIRAFRNVPKAEVVKTLIHHLMGEIPAMSEAASEALAHNAKAADSLLRALTHEKDPQRARIIAKPLAAIGEELTAQQCKNLLERGCKGLVAQDEMGEVFLELLLAVRREKGAAEVVDKALRLRRARKISEALMILVFLAQGEHLDQEGRYQLALTRLLADGKPSMIEAGEVAGGDATMGYFAVLVRECFPVFDRLKKEAAVAPESLLRIGRHFAAGVGNERRFGADVLEYVAERHGKVRAGEEARIALRTGGL